MADQESSNKKWKNVTDNRGGKNKTGNAQQNYNGLTGKNARINNIPHSESFMFLDVSYPNIINYFNFVDIVEVHHDEMQGKLFIYLLLLYICGIQQAFAN